nr:PREDICTED: myoD family inhibitor domain-containing protein-like [Latimeria chalumnae]|eukprot:XP_005995293.1 PREDICTED: myoD family inhibitor domain-containing protein-like [Latimeria chalumnae]
MADPEEETHMSELGIEGGGGTQAEADEYFVVKFIAQNQDEYHNLPGMMVYRRNIFLMDGSANYENKRCDSPSELTSEEKTIKDIADMCSVPKHKITNDMSATSEETLNARKWSESATSLGSPGKYKNKFASSMDNKPIHQPDNEDECASLILACLFCQFCDFLLMLPDACENSLTRLCCPSYRYQHTPDESFGNNDCNCKCDCDCGIFDACHETTECLELALEVSEICYH